MTQQEVSQSLYFAILHLYWRDCIPLLTLHYYVFKNDQITASRRRHPGKGIHLKERQFPITTVCKSQRSDSITLHFAIYNLLVLIHSSRGLLKALLQQTFKMCLPTEKEEVLSPEPHHNLCHQNPGQTPTLHSETPLRQGWHMAGFHPNKGTLWATGWC